MTGGWIKVPRSNLESGLLKKEIVYRVLSYLRQKVVYRPETWVLNGVHVHLEPGQLVTGRKALAEALHTTEAKIRTAIKTLKKYRQIHVKSTNKYSIITLINQDLDDAQSEGLTGRINPNRPAGGPRTNHTQKEEFKEEILKKPDQHGLSPSAVTSKPSRLAISDKLVINEQVIDASYQQKIINYCGGDVYKAGRIFFRASRKSRNIVNWIEDGLKPPCRYALLPIPEESRNPQEVYKWVESNFLHYDEPIKIGDILRNMP